MSYTISEYDPTWPIKFAEIKKVFSEVFGTKALKIEHVGSTSIPGMKAKPLIDVLILVNSIDDLENEKQKARELGYEVREKVLTPQSILFEKRINGVKTENIHVFEESDKSEQFLVMKEYYLTHPEIVKQYEDLKEELYKKFPDSYESYREGKQEFLKETEQLAREWKKNTKS